MSSRWWCQHLSRTVSPTSRRHRTRTSRRSVIRGRHNLWIRKRRRILTHRRSVEHPGTGRVSRIGPHHVPWLWNGRCWHSVSQRHTSGSQMSRRLVISSGGSSVRTMGRNELRGSDLYNTGWGYVRRLLLLLQLLALLHHWTSMDWRRPLDHSALFAHVQLGMVLECTLGTGPPLRLCLVVLHRRAVHLHRRRRHHRSRRRRRRCVCHRRRINRSPRLRVQSLIKCCVSLAQSCKREREIN